MDNQTPRFGRHSNRAPKPKKQQMYELDESEDDLPYSPPVSKGRAPRRSLRKRKNSKAYDSEDDDFEDKPTASKRSRTENPAFVDSRVLCQHLLTNLRSHEFSWPFNQPVDPVALNLPDYFLKISHPMDFSTIQNNLDMESYDTSEDFAADVRLVFSNCLAYNDHNSDIAYMAKVLSASFEQQFTEIKNRESKIVDNQEIGEMKSVINDLRHEHQKLLSELQKLVRKSSSSSPPMATVSTPGVAALQDTYKKSIMKDKAKRSFKTKGYSAPKPAQSAPKVFDYNMKELLSTKINSLSAENLQKMVMFLSSELKQIDPTNNGELEIDLEKLSDATLSSLDNFVNTCLKEQTTEGDAPQNPLRSDAKEAQSDSDSDSDSDSSSDSESERDEIVVQ